MFTSNPYSFIDGGGTINDRNAMGAKLTWSPCRGHDDGEKLHEYRLMIRT